MLGSCRPPSTGLRRRPCTRRRPPRRSPPRSRSSSRPFGSAGDLGRDLGGHHDGRAKPRGVGARRMPLTPRPRSWQSGGHAGPGTEIPMPTESKHPETIVLHAGYRSDPATTAVAVPIYQTTSYPVPQTPSTPPTCSGCKELGNIYTRIMNPTNAVLEERVAALEGGVAALALASGQAASTFAVHNICQAGDNFVSLDRSLRRHLEPVRQHPEGRWASRSASSIRPIRRISRRATDARTRCYYAETLPNPKLAGLSDRRGRRDRPRARRAADHGQHRRAGPLPAVRPWRRGRHALDDQVHRRPRHLDRRHRRRRRQFRLGEARRPLPDC